MRGLVPAPGRLRRVHPLFLAAGLLALLLASSCGDPGPAPRPRHLLLISVDTLRGDHLGCYGSDRPTSPHIDALAHRSALFESAWATSSWTLSSVASLLTSLEVSSHDCWRESDSLAPEHLTLAEVLADAGFRTGAIVNHVFFDRRYRLDQGFDDYDDDLVHQNRRDSHLAITSPEVTEKALRWIEGRSPEERWFLWVHYFDPHAVYQRHEGISERFGRPAPWGIARTRLDLYDGEIAFTDLWIGRLLEGLREKGIDDETLVVFVADHGEEFGEHWQQGHRRHLHREVVQIPLLFAGPGIRPRRVAEPVGIIDVMPTVLSQLGVPIPEGLTGLDLSPAFAGEHPPLRDLLAELRGESMDTAALTSGHWRLIVDDASGSRALYDLDRDLGEQEDIAAREQERADDLELRLRAAVERARAAARGSAGHIE